MLHFTDLILRVSEINDNLLAADADHRKGDDQAAINRYQRIGRIIDDLRYEKSMLFDETVRVWEKSTFPKDFRHVPGGREKFVHQIDRDFYYGNKTMDLSYIFEIEEQLGLFGLPAEAVSCHGGYTEGEDPVVGVFESLSPGGLKDSKTRRLQTPESSAK